MRRGLFYLALLMFLSSCGLHLPVGVEDVSTRGGSLVITVENFLPQVQRTIAPGHISTADLQNQYELRLTGTNGFQSLPEQTVTLVNGRTTLPNIPVGLWELTLTAYTRTGNVETLRGRASVSVTALEVSPASFTLKPLLTGNGTVNVQFTLPQGLVKRLDPQNNASKPVTVALYYDEVDAEVPNTKQTFTMTAGGTITYTANSRQVPEGQYTIRLSATYTVNNASTLFQNATYDTGYEDVLCVESNRQTSAAITIPDTVLGVPYRPHRRDKVAASSNLVGNNQNTFTAVNITGSQSYSPYGEGLWIHGANWDGGGGMTAGAGGNKGETWGNEVLLVTWSSVYNADFYELEILLHPKYGYSNTSNVHNTAKYEKLPVTDAEWNEFRGRSPAPNLLSFSGVIGDTNYYKTKTYTFPIYIQSATVTSSWTFVAWRAAANGKNGSYAVATSGDAAFVGPPNGGGVTRFKNVDYRIGLEGDCNALAILMNGFTPQHWYGIRVRGVNEFGYSDWVYWKGGKN